MDESAAGHDGDGSQGAPDMPSSHAASGSSQHSPSYSPSVALASHDHQRRQRVYLYRLHAPVVVAFVRWGPFAVLYNDVVQALGVDPTQVVMPHHVHAKPVGEQPNEESLIVQMLGDVPLASDAQLILLDVIVHDRGLDGMSLAPQTTDRRVVSVQCPLTRVHLLQYARVENYCDLVQHRCLVRVNNALWPLPDLGPRELTLATYVQISIPPHPTIAAPTIQTLELAEDTAMVVTDVQFATFYPDWFPTAALCGSGESRLVRLPLDPTQWRGVLQQAWSDWLLPGLAVQFYVVTPAPLDDPGVVAHIIIAQNQLEGFASVLISSLVPDDNPWQPVHRVVKLPVVVDHFLLVHEGGLVNMCPPLSFSFKCQSWIGAHELTQGHLRLASSGDGYLIAASHVPRDPTSPFDPSEMRIDRLFRKMSTLLTDLTVQGLDDHELAACLKRHCSLVPPLPSSECLGLAAGLSGSAVDVLTGPPVPLSLEACLHSTRPFDPDKLHTPECLPWPCDWPKLISDVEVCFGQLPEFVPLSPATLHALELPELYVEPALANMSVYYVDGSSDGLRAAWSVVHVVYSSDGVPMFSGCLAGPVELCASHENWIGAVSADNVAAELTATLAALVSTFCADASLPVVIRPDLRLSAMLAQGLWHCRSHPKLVRLCQLLGQWFQKVSGAFCEVRGHSHHPWNDLADSVARHQLSATDGVGLIQWTPFAQLVQSADLDWACSIQVCHGECACAWFGSAWETLGLLPSVLYALIVNGMPKVSQLLVSKKREELLVKCGQSITCAFSSGAQTSQRATRFGCELWIHSQLPLDVDGQLRFCDFQAAVVVADPRRLVVTLSHGQLCLSFVVLHVPCVTPACTVADVEQWWTATIALLASAQMSPFIWVFADLNAPLASVESEWCGLAGTEPSNPQGLLAEQALQTLQWYAPTIMPWCHVGQHVTWTHPRGSQARRDFILCSSAAFELCQCSWVDREFDGGFAHDDHFPVILESAGWLQCDVAIEKTVWDPLAFVDPFKCQQFQSALRTLLIPSWSVHVDCHAELFEAQLPALAKQRFSKKSFDRPRPRLSEATLNLIQFKRSCLDFGRRQGLMQDEGFKLELMAVEKDVRRAVRGDQRRFYDSLVDQLAHAGDLHNSKQVYRLLTRIGGRKASAASMRAFPLLNSAGTPQQSFEAQQRLWMKQFADIEAGTMMSRDSYRHLLPPALGVPAVDFELAVLPTLDEVRTQIHRMKRGKALALMQFPGCP
eukprot:s1179_g9.t2